MMDQWPTDIEDPPLQDNQSDPEDKDGGYHSNDSLEEMDRDDLNLNLDFQMQREIDFLKGLEEIGRVDSSTAFSELMKPQTVDQWAWTESERPLVRYDKKSKRKAYLDAQKVREKEVGDWQSRERSVLVIQINDNVTHMHSSLSAAQF